MGMSGSSSAVNGQNINHAMKFDEDEKNDPLGIEDILCFSLEVFLNYLVASLSFSQVFL